MGILRKAGVKLFGTPEQRKEQKKRKEQYSKIYDKELHKSRLKEAKRQARVDAKKKPTGFLDRLGGGIGSFASGLDSLTGLDDGPFNFSGSGLQPHKKSNKRGPEAFSGGLDSLTRLDDGPFNFSGSGLQPKSNRTKKKKKRGSKPKRKEVYYY